MYWKVRADNFFNTTIDSLINDTDVVGTFNITSKTVNWYTLEDWDYMFWMVVWLSNQDELEIFRIVNVNNKTLTYDKRISPNWLYEHASWQICVMTVVDEFMNYISKNTNDFWYVETVSWTGNELKVKVMWGKVENPAWPDVDISDTTLTLSTSLTYYIYFDDTDNTFKASVTEPATYKILAKVITDTDSVDSIEDYRAVKWTLWLVPVSLTEAEMLAFTDARNWTIIYNSTAWADYQFLAWSRYPFAAGSTQPNASTTVAGKVEVATAAEVVSWAETWSTWAYLSITPKDLKDNYKAGNGLKKTTTDFEVDTTDTDVFVKTSTWAADENKIPVLDVNGKADVFISDASATVKGKVELATNDETLAGTDTERAVTPAWLKYKLVWWNYDVEYSPVILQYSTNVTGIYPLWADFKLANWSSSNYMNFSFTNLNSWYFHLPQKLGGSTIWTLLKRQDCSVVEMEADIAFQSSTMWLLWFSTNNFASFYTPSSTVSKSLISYTWSQIEISSSDWTSSNTSDPYTLADVNKFNRYKMVVTPWVDIKLYINWVLRITRTVRLPALTDTVVWWIWTNNAYQCIMQNFKIRIKYS